MDKVLGRSIYDSRTDTWSFVDGSGVIPDEMRFDLELALEKRDKLGCNGVAVLGTLFEYKDRLNRR